MTGREAWILTGLPVGIYDGATDVWRAEWDWASPSRRVLIAYAWYRVPTDPKTVLRGCCVTGV